MLDAKLWVTGSSPVTPVHAGMVELVDTGDLKSPSHSAVRVQVPLPVRLVYGEDRNDS